MNNEKINSKIKLSNDSSFVILIFVILKFRNISRSTFHRFKFWPPPEKTMRTVSQIIIFFRSELWGKKMELCMEKQIFIDSRVMFVEILQIEQFDSSWRAVIIFFY